MLALFLMAACDGGELSCDTMAVASVNVTVTDESGAAVPDLTLTWSVDGGEEQPCDSVGDTYACGWEVAGDITVRASAPGFVDAEQTVTVEMGTCHPEPQALAFELVSACDDPPPALQVTVLTPDGEPAAGEAVTWGLADADMAPQACDEEPDGTWVCGYGVWGEVELYVVPAESDPYQDHFEVVTVSEGTCGPDTQFVTVTFEYLPD